MIRVLLSGLNTVQIAAIGISALAFGVTGALTPPKIPAPASEDFAAEIADVTPGRKIDLSIAVEKLASAGFVRTYGAASNSDTADGDGPVEEAIEVPTIVAIVLSKGVPVVYAKVDGRVVLAEQGDVLGVWSVEEIRSDSIVLKHDERTEIATPFSRPLPAQP